LKDSLSISIIKKWTAVQTGNPTVTQHYFEELEKRGWTANHIKIKATEFTPLSADRPCASMQQFVGYKDNQIRIVGISYDTKPYELTLLQ